MDIKELSFTEEKVRFKKGDFIFKEQEDGRFMYFVDSGRAKIIKKVGDDEATLVILDTGDFFGEMALITSNKRVASAVAFTDCKLHSMNKESFDANLLHSAKFMKTMLETLAFRLEETNVNLKRHLKRISRLSKTFNITG